jgi:hypothetical protein
LERQTPEFLAAREEGRRIRRMETDAIKEFVAYAKAQGSSRAESKGYKDIFRECKEAVTFVLG